MVMTASMMIIGNEYIGDGSVSDDVGNNSISSDYIGDEKVGVFTKSGVFFLSLMTASQTKNVGDDCIAADYIHDHCISYTMLTINESSNLYQWQIVS